MCAHNSKLYKVVWQTLKYRKITFKVKLLGRAAILGKFFFLSFFFLPAEDLHHSNLIKGRRCLLRIIKLTKINNPQQIEKINDAKNHSVILTKR